MIKLYQFPISHYCEKIRWALDYKYLDYEPITLLPGFHAKKTIKLVGKSSVPVLVDGQATLTNSSDIINYLDQAYPDRPLTPLSEQDRGEALEWESFADNEIGDHVRRLCYHYLLEHPDIVIPYFTKGGPWYGPPLMKLIFPKLQVKMRKYMKINDSAAQISKDKIDRALDRIIEHRQKHDFMVGEEFTRADLAIAALFAPLCRPEGYGLMWPETFPEPLEELVAGYADKLNWVNELYIRHR